MRSFALVFVLGAALATAGLACSTPDTRPTVLGDCKDPKKCDPNATDGSVTPVTDSGAKDGGAKDGASDAAVDTGVDAGTDGGADAAAEAGPVDAGDAG